MGVRFFFYKSLLFAMSTLFVTFPVVSMAQAMSAEVQKNSVVIEQAAYRSSMISVAGKNEIDPSKAEIEEGASNFVDSMANRALGFLGNEEMDNKEKKARFKELLESSFDMDTIGRFSLGRYWRVSTKQQREEYLALFRKMVVAIYSGRFLDYSGERFEIRDSRPDGTRDTIVNSFIVPEHGTEIQVDWRVRYKNGRYQIVDVVVEGVSMSVTHRSEFSSVIQRGGGNVQVLIAHLREH